MIFDFWVSAMIALFVTITLFGLGTPAYNEISTTFGEVGDFMHVPTNNSWIQTREYNDNMWNLWPLGAGVIVFLVLMIAGGDEDELRFNR